MPGAPAGQGQHGRFQVPAVLGHRVDHAALGGQRDLALDDLGRFEFLQAGRQHIGRDAREVLAEVGVAAGAGEQAAKQTTDTTVLVNNAAIFPRSELLTGPADELSAVIQTNLVGPIQLTRALGPSLVAAKGALVNVNSVLSWLAVGKAHSVSKAGLWMATNAFRLELAPQGVHVLGVYPGPIDTPMQPGEDLAGMTDPVAIADAVYDSLEAGEYELLTDETASKVHGALAAPVTALYPALAG